MERTIAVVSAVVLFFIPDASTAAEMTLVRNSRPVTAAEVAGGAPSGAMVHDFFATSDADLLSLATGFNQSVYQHPYGSDNEAPTPELINYYPAAAVDSFLTLPSSTLMLGGGFRGPGPEKAWGDLSDDGPQTDFLFGRLTTTEPSSFAGAFYVRGEETYVELSFGFSLPSQSGALNETLYLSAMEPTQPQYMTPAVNETTSLDLEPIRPKPFPGPQLKSWFMSLPVFTSPAISEILSSGDIRPLNLVRVEMNTGAMQPVPEPAAWLLSAIGLALVLKRRPASLC